MLNELLSIQCLANEEGEERDDLKITKDKDGSRKKRKLSNEG